MENKSKLFTFTLSAELDGNKIVDRKSPGLKLLYIV